ncbi:MAG: MBL fold metallo-hydrolase [Phycisphaeraceae bacterium]|nr:MBL fold metallo-hydrolase [Phycisphaeraceae bacterium]
MSQALDIQTFTLGDFQTNCYLLQPEDGGCWFVDAGQAPEPMIRAAEAAGKEPAGVLLTHAHADHIAGLDAITGRWPGIAIHIHPEEAAFLTDPWLNLSAMMGHNLIAPEATGHLQDGMELRIGSTTWSVLHTPGHSPGGITLYCAQLATAIVGDTLFAQSIGRYDFPTSDGPTLMASIRQRLLTLPDETRVLPGHGPATTIGDEKRLNPFLSD